MVHALNEGQAVKLKLIYWYGVNKPIFLNIDFIIRKL